MANKPIKSVNLLPGIFRTDKNDKFLSSTIDQLIQPPQLERLDGFIGSKFTPTYVSTSDIYISESLPLRQKYQLEPALIIKDSLNNIEQTKAIDDLANEINLEGGFNNNFDRLFRSEFYALDPQIDFDKFVNYQKYYWLITGPQTITITGKQLNSTSTYTIIDNEIKSAWVFSPDGLTEDPTLILYRNNTYSFSIDSTYKFYIKTAPTVGLDDVYNTNVINNGTNKGVVTIFIDETTPSTLYYTSDEVNFVQGKIEIKVATEDSYIDVDNEIIGKQNYVSGTGVKLSNGMKIKFGGEVFPETYKDKEYFVEGVGKSITLIDYNLLEVAEVLSAQFDDDFDVTNFDQYPFDNFRKLPLTPEYLTINRASRDLNPWSRYNRWVHEDIIKISAEFNGTQPIYPSDKRARRPIIEFNANLQLYNFGSVGIKNIDVIDNDTTDAFSTVEGSAGYYVDGVLLQQGHRVVFNADTDSLVRGKVYQVNFVNIDNVPKLQLVQTDDHNPSLYNSISVNFGNTYKDKTWWWNGDVWVLAQQHDKLNQAPLFDVFDKDGISFSSSDYKTNFSGCKIFSYEVGNGQNDPILGFPLSYQNTVNIGSFKFVNHFTSDTFSLFQNDNTVETISTALGYLRYNDIEERFTNVWSLTEPYQIPIIQTIVTDQTTATVFVTAVENPVNDDLNITAFINGVKIPTNQYGYGVQGNKVILGFDFPVEANSNIFVKILTNSSVNNESDGQYEPPLGLTNNPLNGGISSLTLTEISDHYKTMVERLPGFVGAIFGSNNSRDLYNISKYGTRLISNANPLVFSNIFLGIKDHDVVKSIQQAADQYNQYKYNLLKKIAELGNINNPVLALDNILSNINSDKDLNSPWYYSEMLAYGNDKTTRTWTVTDIRNTVYPIKEDFDSNKLSFRSVLVYLNGIQLILDKDYRFLVNDSSVEILIDIKVGDRLTVEDYFSTEGSYVPATPTKLGLYPKYEPMKYQDNTYVTPTNVIQGHDGSLMVAFNDFRDDIILEYEKRIFNNIKVSYKNDLIDFHSVMPGAFRQGQYSIEEVNKILLRDFVRYTSLYNIDYITNSTFDLAETLTWNYSGGKTVSNEIPVNGYWRNIFKYLYDTDRPNTHPWEMLGFSQQPDWWEDEYGPAPYTSGNTILWHDIELGRIKFGPREGIDNLYVRTGLSNLLPVDEFGNLKDPTSLITNTTPFNIRQSWVFGDQGPAETSWRRSSYYPFAVQRLLALTKTSYYSAWMFDVSRMNKNIANQWTYGEQKEFIKPKNLSLYSLNNTLAAGYSIYVIESGKQRTSNYLTTLQNNLNYLDFNLLYKVGGFVSKNKLQILIDAIDPSSISSGALLPQESYNLILNTSNPVTNASMSGVIIQKFNGKFVLKGYDQFNPYFTVFTPRRNTNTPTITVGGTSEPFVVWTASQDGGNTELGSSDSTSAQVAATGNFYKQGQVVFYNQKYYRTKVSHKATNIFNSANFEQLPFLPTIGGVSVQQANGWFNEPVVIPYGSEFNTIQEVYDILVGYGKWLEYKGFVFNEYNSDINEILNWNLSAKEFMYWTTQNWAENSIITLSPFAGKIQYSFPDTIVDNIFDNFYSYSIFKADGLPLPPENINVTRNEGLCTIETLNTTDGIYFIELRSVQKEHAMVFDNTTIFNDTIYETETGYRQRRMKLKGFRTKDWNGDYYSPGFVFDKAEISEWQKYTTYLYADTVRYNGNYYSAKQNIVGSEQFDFNQWVALSEKPQADLIPNFEYKINQFEDFYSLDIDNFDDAQQKMAQHLIGYTPRVYLNNVFTNPITQYKFYQGFIKEKGTRNSLAKIAKSSIFNAQGEISYNEEWALRVGQYGAYSSFEEIEIKLEEGSFIENPQNINFVVTKPNNPIDLIYYTTASNIAIRPQDYLPSQTFVTTSTDNFILPSAGYVSFEDITATAYNENSLLDIANSNQINAGDIFWLGFKSNGNWDVLRYTIQKARVTGVYVSSPGIDITFVTDLFHGLSVNDIIVIERFNAQVNGVYRVKSIPKLNQITVESTLVTILNEELKSPGLLYKFASARSATYDSLPDDSEMLRLPYGSKFWIDNETGGTYNWEVYNKIQNFNPRNIRSGLNLTGEKFGISLYKADNSNILLLGSTGFNNVIDNGRAYAFIKGDQTSNRLISFSLNESIDQIHPTIQNTDFGSSLAYNVKNFPGTNYGLIYVGSPGVSDVKSTGTILSYAVSTASIQTYTNIGAVKIVSINPVGPKASTEIVLLSPQKLNDERFGESLLFNNNTNLLLVGAPGTLAANSGQVYIYQSIAPEAKTKSITSATSGTTQIYIASTASIKPGYGVLIENLITNITDNFLIDSIVSTPLESYINLNQPIPDDCPIDSIIRFYNTATLNTTYGVNVSPNGLITSFYNTITATTSVVGDQFGYAMANSADGKYTVISAPGGDYVETFVDINSNSFIRAKHITPFSTGTRFGESVAMSSGGELMFVGSPNIKNSDNSFGKVAVYVRNGNTFTYTTSITNPLAGAGTNFGKKIAIDFNTTTLAISAIGINKGVPVGFDAGTTNFDSSSTTFSDTINDFGTVYVYNKSNNGNRFVLADNLLPPLTGNLAGNNFGYSLALDSTSVIVGAPAITSLSTSSFYQFNKIDKSKNSLDLYKTRSNIVDIETIQNIRLIDTFNEKVLDYLDVIDPIKGKISGVAEQELKYRAAYDPAVYSLGTAGVVVDTDTSWLDEHVGELWWDLSTVKYVLYEQGDLTYRKNNWGAVFPGATIDVYEWVRSPYLPSEWVAIADTSRGLTEGISGQPKYADNSCIAVKQVYNSVSNSFSNVYYFWVKNKVTVPNAKNRRISAYQTANIIADPTGYGLRYAAPISNDAIALANVASLLVDNRVHLNISFDKIKNNRLKHTEWTLLEEGSAISMPPPLYEKKLFDSLLGRDNLGNIVPDPTLTEREKYGIGIRPRQTLFKNRREALRNIIEYTNHILSENQITGLYNFENLNSQELPPDETLNEYDILLEDNEGLNIIDTRGFEQASLSCTVDNGRIRAVSIDKSGFGYRIAPNVVIGNGGFDAVITTIIDSGGRVIGANIVNAGRQYSTPPTLYVRPFTALVLADNLYNGKWTKFEFDNFTKQWNRKQTQKYNTTLYWNYIDWKSTNYNQFIDYTYTIEQVYQLDTLEDLTIGQYVKIKNIGDGRYVVVEKAVEGDEGTFGKGFNLVYSQNGTIKISDEIWNVRETTLNFDQNNTYDQTLYDQFPDIELFYILTALKQDIFINELKINWNLLFFKAIKYALTEQKLLDWAFKTSFINVTNNAGLLGQTPIYKFFATDNYEDYLKEVKPYHSKIRSYTTNHGIFEPSNSNFTDFDLPAYYNENTDKFESVSPDDAITSQQPWKTWNENYPCKVGNIIVGDGGSGYTFAPQVTIVTAPGDTGFGATARAFITSGKVSKIEVTNPGSNYKLAPTVILSGGGNANLIPAKVYARITNEKVRSNQIAIKFDRIARGSEIGERAVVDTFVCDGSANEYVLTWYADIDKNKITVTLDQDLVLGSDYNLVNYEELYNGYTKKYTKIVFVTFVPSYGQILAVNYLKNIELYNAAERILEFYQPNSGMPGNDLPQLMTGIEYPGVNVQGLTFDYSTSWDISYSPFGNFSYSDNVNYYKKADIVAPTTFGTDTVVVSDITDISVGQIVNIISADKLQSTSTVFYNQIIDPLKDVKVIDINTVTNRVKFNSTLSTILTATTYQINEFDNIDLTNTNILITTTASIEFWSYDANFSILDTAIDGGSWSTVTNTLTGALGINPEDIIISGDFFLTPESSYAPEELVPGEVHDSLGLNVFTRNNEGAPVIYNGTIDVFANTITTATLTFLPPNKSSIFVTFNNNNFSYVDNNIHLLPGSLNYTNFSIDWTTGKITIGRQTTTGKLGYTIVGIGGGSPNTFAGVIDRDIQIVNDGSSQAELISFSSSSTVKSAYVTVNGSSIPNLATLNTSTLGYVLTDSITNPNRVSAKVVNLSTSTTSTVQAYFFGSPTKYFNEFKEQIFLIDFDLTDSFILDQPPGSIEPAAANIIVEKDIGNGFVRLQPPFISYYKVDPSVLIYKVDNNIDRTGLGFIDTNIRLYLNGVKLTYPLDWDFDYSTQLITIKPNILQQNDVLAILGIPTGGTGPSADYDIEGNILRLLSPISNATLKVTTFTNHDDMMVRTETFTGTLNRRFKVSRHITNSNYVWVTVDGILLVNGIDFTVLDDGRTIQLSDKWHPSVNSKVNITTISSDKVFDTTLGYRIFNDIFNRTHYKRLSKKNSTTLVKELYATDTEIHVADTSMITPPLNSKKIPGIVYINGERIEFTNLDGNVLRNIRRSTIGTGPAAYLPIGTKVVDQGINQNIPFRDNLLKQTIITTSTTASYVISATTFISSSTILDTQLVNNGIILSTTATINPVDQIEVYYNNRKLRKSGIYKHDISYSFDSPEFTLIGTTSSSALLPITDVLNSAYIVTSTNEIWVFTNSLEETAINGYVYKGLKYYPPEYTVSVSINTQTAAIYATTASSIVSMSPQDLAFDIDGSGAVTAADVAMYTSLANGNYVDGISVNSNYRDLLVQHITLNIDGGIQDNVKMVIVKKEFDKQYIWNSQITSNSTYSLLESTTIQARFLQAATAELPNDTNFYGSIQPLDTNSGLVLLNENNEPLEGL